MKDFSQINSHGPVWVIIPAKPLEQAKSRLSDILNLKQRRNLAYHLFQHTLQVLLQLQENIPQLHILVISSDETLLAESQHQKIQTLFEKALANTEDSNARLNLALSQAAKWCAAQSQNGTLLILPTDLPFLKVEDLLTFLNISANSPTPAKFVINSDRANIGTNTLLIQPPDLLQFEFCFGTDSFAKHLELARLNNLPQPIVTEIPNLTFDLDHPSDFSALPEQLQQNLIADYI